MTSTMRKGLIVAALHVAIVSSLGAKLLVDRATRPRVWTRAAPFDPNLPIRGRYVRLRIKADPLTDSSAGDSQFVPIAYFIPEHVPDPSIRQPGEELWVEVTVPRAGAPRPIRLGVKKDGVLTPLDVR
jgi:hypothetical protein